MKGSRVSPYQTFVDRWSGGCGNDICGRAQHVVLARGDVPCDILFVGEAPGKAEDTLGDPFVGPSGQLLDYIVIRSFQLISGVRDPVESWTNPIYTAFTNLVGCVPRDEHGVKAVEPAPEDIIACAPRLREFVEICKPRLIVAVGSLARDYLDGKMLGSVWHPSTERPRDAIRDPKRRHEGATIKQCHVTHPAAILRASVAQQGLAVQQAAVTIAGAWRDLNQKADD